jgi:hypothetical protein
MTDHRFMQILRFHMTPGECPTGAGYLCETKFDAFMKSIAKELDIDERRCTTCKKHDLCDQIIFIDGKAHDLIECSLYEKEK